MQEFESAGGNPFPGLRPFESTETHLFFGRDGQSEELIKRLRRKHFLAVVGTSGSGKSSLVRAGLLPALQGGLMASAGSDWRIAVFRPGHNPIGNLAHALMSPQVFGSEDQSEAAIQSALAEATLRRSSLGLLDVVRQARTGVGPDGQPSFRDYENLLVVVDQFEEIFRFRQLIEVENSKEDAAAFVKLLLEAIARPEQGIYVVLTMRSDFLGDCAQFWELPEAINDGQYLIPRMTRDERREAIIGPIAVGGARITEPLVSQLLNDVGDNPDQLPILQHALMRTWDLWEREHRDGEPIDINHYTAIGGMSEALSLHAEEAYAELSETGQRIAEKLFKGLTEKGADNREVRRPMELGEVCALVQADRDEVIRVIDVFRRPGRSFLMPPATVPLDDESLLDISHESLIRNWQRLKSWAEEEAQSARIYQRLAERAALHEQGQEPLLTGPALQVALDWREKNRPNQVWASRYHPGFATAIEFLDQSVIARDAEALEREKQLRRETSYKRTRWLALILGLSFILAASSTYYASQRLKQARAALAEAGVALERADQQRAIADDLKQKAEQRSQEAIDEKEIAKKEKREAQEAEALSVKEKEVAVVKSKQAEEARQLALVQKQQAETAHAQAEVAKAQAVKDAEIARQLKEAAVNESNQAKYESRVAEGLMRQSNKLVYGSTLNLAQTQFASGKIGRAREMLDEAWKFDFINGKEPEELRGFEWGHLWRLFHRYKAVLQGHKDTIRAMAYTPDGRFLATSSNDMKMILWDTATLEPQQTIGGTEPVNAFAVAPDSRTLAISRGREIKFWDIYKAEYRGEPVNSELTDDTQALSFSPDGKTVAFKSAGNTVRVLDVASRQVKASMDFKLPPDALVFSPVGQLLAVGVGDAVRIFDLSHPEQKEGVALGEHYDTVTSLAFSRDGRMLALSSNGAGIELWDIATRQRVRLLKEEQFISALAFSPNGKRLAAGLMDKRVELWEVATGQELATEQVDAPVTSLAYAPDGETLSVGSGTEAKLLNMTSPPPRSDIQLSEKYSDKIMSLAFQPDGKSLVAAGDEGHIFLRDTERGETVSLEVSGNALFASALSPDGRTLAAAGQKGLDLLDLSGRKEPEHLSFDNRVFRGVAFSPDGETLALGNSINGEVLILDAATKKVRQELKPVSAPAMVLAFSRDGKLLAVGHRNGLLRVFETAAYTQQASYKDKPFIRALAFSPDGTNIACGLDTGLVNIWPANSSGENVSPLKRLKGNYSPVQALAFSPDGQTLATGGQDRNVKLWKTGSYQELMTLGSTRFSIFSLAFSPDGKSLYAGNSMGQLYQWRAATEEEIKAGREKDAEEKRAQKEDN